MCEKAMLTMFGIAFSFQDILCAAFRA